MMTVFLKSNGDGENDHLGNNCNTIVVECEPNEYHFHKSLT